MGILKFCEILVYIPLRFRLVRCMIENGFIVTEKSIFARRSE